MVGCEGVRRGEEEGTEERERRSKERRGGTGEGIGNRQRKKDGWEGEKRKERGDKKVNK